MKKYKFIFAALGVIFFAAYLMGFARPDTALAQSASDQHDAQSPEQALPFDYDVEIEAAKARGSNITADYLATCRDTPAGGVLLIPASMEENILDLCEVRDFEVRVSTIVWRPTIGTQSGSSGTHSAGVPTQTDSVATCRAAAAKRITHCEMKVSFCGGSLDCEEVICNTNFTGCNDTWSGGPFEYYCDMGNSWNRDARYENVLAKACPTQ